MKRSYEKRLERRFEDSKLFLKIKKRVKAVAGIKTLLVFSMSAISLNTLSRIPLRVYQKDDFFRKFVKEYAGYSE